MPEPKAQLIDPQGPIDVPGISATGIITATGGFVGAVQGAATGLANTTSNLNVGVVTSTGFVGDVTGTASSVTKGANLSLGIVTASSFAGDVFGNAAGLSTTTAGLKLGIVSATSFAGNFTGIGSGITGTPNIQAGIMTATSFAGNFTGLASGITGTPNLMVGILTGTAYSGDGSNLTGIAATNWIGNNVTANSSTTAIDLSNGNTIKFTQTANTTVSFANTGTSNILTFIRANGSGTITWPSSVKWNNGTKPTLLSNPRGTDAQVFNLLTRDEGVTWYGWETVSIDPQTAELYSWGRNTDYGELGTNNKTNRSSPVQVPGTNWGASANGGNSFGGGENHTVALKTDGTLWAWGRDSRLGQNNNTTYSSPKQIPGTTWNGVTALQDSSLATKSDGTLWAWGSNGNGTLGQNAPGNSQRSSPVQIPGTTWAPMATKVGRMAFAVKTDGTLWAWGNNENGSLGVNDNQIHRSSPTQIPGTTWNADGIWGGYEHSGGTKTDGTLFMWGRNEGGQFGNNTAGNPTNRSSPIQIPGTTWKQISGGNSWTIASKTDGTLWSWGSNGQGQLGLNNRTSYSSPIQIPGTTWDKLSGQGNNVLAIKTDGTLWSWGYQVHGQLGLNQASVRKSSPTQIPGSWTEASGGWFIRIALKAVD